jgi:fructose PTS system EIIBC or EIIC component
VNNVLRHLRESCIALEPDFTPTPLPEDEDEETDVLRLRRERHDKDRLLTVFAHLLSASGDVSSTNKLIRDLDHRERKATTAVAPGVAIPHVRSMQMRNFVMGYVRAPEPGWPFLSLDGDPTRHFFLLASPPWDDKLYHQIYKELAEFILDEDSLGVLDAAQDPQDVFNAFRAFFVR